MQLLAMHILRKKVLKSIHFHKKISHFIQKGEARGNLSKSVHKTKNSSMHAH